MKKKIFIVSAVILIVTIALILIFLNTDMSKKLLPPATDPTTTEKTTPVTPIELYNVSIPNTKNWKTDGLATLGLTDMKISESADCVQGKVYIISKPYVGIYIALETPDKILLTFTGNCFSPENTFSLKDVDGDAMEEIILNQFNGGVGGFGQYYSSVWKLSDNGFESIFDTRTSDKDFDTGFESKTQTPFKLVISNRITGYETVIDYSQKTAYIDTIFDKEGNPANINSAWFDTFYYFEPIDIEGDGVFEILCKQYTSLYSHVDYIGDTHIVIKYDNTEKKFKVIDATFVEESDTETN